jgi:hypothetical protein
MRRYYPVAALLILLAAIALSASIVTTSANALPTFTNPAKGIGPCDSCHKQDATHAKHATVACATCHTAGVATPPSPAACASCHGAAAILASATHVAQGCGTTPGCHGVPVPTPITTAVSLKVAPASIKFKKTVVASGAVTPAADLAGIKVVLKAEIKIGKAWKAAKTTKATVSATGTYSWTYVPAKKGSYRMTATIVGTTEFKGSKSPTRLFKVN